jgi:hypothetical protein
MIFILHFNFGVRWGLFIKFVRCDQEMVAEVQKITLQKLTFEGKLEKS